MSNRNTILLTGGTGKISRHLVPLLSAVSHQVLIASRSGACPPLHNCKAQKFDWLDSLSYSNIDFSPISAVLLIAPPILDPFPPMRIFIELAVSQGVKRLVLISGSLVGDGDGPMMARVSKYITSLGVEYAILRPSWFMENFLESPHVDTICNEDAICTASGYGKIPFIACADISAVAFMALTCAKSLNRNVLLLGPELLSYDDIANLLSFHLGRTIRHTHISEDILAQSMAGGGIELEYAKVLAQLDTAVKKGGEERMNNMVYDISGKIPMSMKKFIMVNVENGVWDSVAKAEERQKAEHNRVE